MKAIVLISSIFYILGLKISDKIDLIKRSNPVEKIITHTAKPEKAEKSIELKEAEALKPEKDTTCGGGSCADVLQNK